jgi:hypothetical protein
MTSTATTPRIRQRRRAVTLLALSAAVAGTALVPATASALRRDQAPVQVTVKANKTHIDLGKKVKLTFKIAGPRSAGPAFGQIRVFDGVNEIATVPVDHSKAVIQLSGLGAGDHALSGAYDGDDTHAANETGVLHVTVD